MNEPNENQKLKVGDIVYRSCYNSLSKETIVSVAKTTATTNLGTKLRIDVGSSGYINVIVKDKFPSYHYRIESTSLNYEYERQQLVTGLKRKLEGVKINELSTERIREIIDFLQ